jgi:hypothetical protein
MLCDSKIYDLSFKSLLLVEQYSRCRLFKQAYHNYLYKTLYATYEYSPNEIC